MLNTSVDIDKIFINNYTIGEAYNTLTVFPVDLYAVWSTSFLPLLQGLLWPGVVVSVRAPSMVQIDLFKNYSYLIRPGVCKKKKKKKV